VGSSALGLRKLLLRLPRVLLLQLLPGRSVSVKSWLLRPPAASENEERRWTPRCSGKLPSRDDLLLAPDSMASLKDERRGGILLLLLLLTALSPALFTTPLLRIMVSSGDSTPVSAAALAQDARPCAPGTLLMASARIFFALLMLPRVPAAAAAAAPPVEPLGERWPSKPREAIALTMLQELLLLRALPLVPWLAMGAQGLPQNGASCLLSWLKRCLLMLLCWRLGRQRLKLDPTESAILPGVLQAERGETGGLAAASLRPASCVDQVSINQLISESH
jgi:hypothetical protein